MTDHFQPGSHYAFSHSIPDAKTDFIEQRMFDLAYANLSPAQKLDVYWPAQGNAPFPVIIAIHGGAFMGGDKRDLQLIPMLTGLQRGYAGVSINYRMSGEARFPAWCRILKLPFAGCAPMPKDCGWTLTESPPGAARPADIYR